MADSEGNADGDAAEASADDAAAVDRDQLTDGERSDAGQARSKRRGAASGRAARPEKGAGERKSGRVATKERAESGKSTGKTGVTVDRKTGDSKRDRKTGRSRNPLTRSMRFVREVVAELRKVVYPNRKELVTYAAVVIVFLVIMTSIVGLLDYGFARLALLVFGGPESN